MSDHTVHAIASGNLPLLLRFGVLESELDKLFHDLLEDTKINAPHLIAPMASEVAQMRAKFSMISQWAMRRMAKKT